MHQKSLKYGVFFLHEIDPSMGDEAHQEELNDAHSGDLGGPDKIMRC